MSSDSTNSFAVLLIVEVMAKLDLIDISLNDFNLSIENLVATKRKTKDCNTGSFSRISM